MKNIIKSLFKKLGNGIIVGFGIVLGLIVMIYGITWPSSTPAGETPGGKFYDWFVNKIFQPCPYGKVLKGYDPTTKNPICVYAAPGIGGISNDTYTCLYEGFNALGSKTWSSSSLYFSATGVSNLRTLYSMNGWYTTHNIHRGCFRMMTRYNLDGNDILQEIVCCPN